MTSANVTQYRIYNKDNVKVGDHYQHHYCKTHWDDLLKFDPVEDHTIIAWWYDEEEEYNEDEPENLKAFLVKRRILK